VDTDLKPFLVVRKQKVLTALQYLVSHNYLYQEVMINHLMMNDWPDDFIPHELQDHIICCDKADHHKREGYIVNLQEGNYKNDWQAAEGGSCDSGKMAPFMTGSVTTDINGERQNPNMRTLDAVLGLVTDQLHDTTQPLSGLSHITRADQLSTCQSIPVIRYTIKGQAILLNYWDNPCYFTAAFPTLFPTSRGGHLELCSVPVSLEAFAD
jgi:hypothetical protein